MSRTTRRRFAQLAGAAVAAPLILPHAAPAQTPAPPPAPAQPEPPAAPKPLAVALTEVIRAQWGEHLDAEQMKKVGDDMNDAVGAIERLRKFPLTNADEPDASFAAAFGRPAGRRTTRKS